MENFFTSIVLTQRVLFYTTWLVSQSFILSFLYFMSFLPPWENIIETKKCRISGKDFFVTDKDLEFYDKISPVFGGQKYRIPSPTLCSDERQKRRLAFRNERKLYHRKCDKTGNQIISIYSPDKPYKVYDQKVWWSDDWSPFDYGMKFDFERWFFEQFGELIQQVPLPASLGKNLENSDYTLHSSNLKNCYLAISVAGWGENLYYVHQANNSKNCIDCSYVYDSEYCYECVDTHRSYHTLCSQDCDNCRECIFCYDCKNCTNCLFCFNLRWKQYYIHNKQYTKEQYMIELGRFSITHDGVSLKGKIQQEKNTIIHRYIHWINNENCIWDYLNNCSWCFECFNYADGENLRYINTGRGSKDSYDCNYTAFGSTWGVWSTWCWECLSPFPAHYTWLSMYVWDCTNALYSNNCHGSNDIFWCSSFKKSHHCILNKSYSIQEYETLCGKIIDHMRSTGEWGEFFPHELSPFGYDETVAQEYFPMTESEVREKGWNWKWEEETSSYHWPYYTPLPISQYDERVVGFDVATKNINECLNWIIQCEIIGKPFKIIKQELAFYIENSIPIPTKHPDQRHRERIELRNPRNLCERTCSECHNDIVTTYLPDRSEKVVCEDCYRKLVY